MDWNENPEITVEKVIVPLIEESDLKSRQDTFLTLSNSEKVDFVYESVRNLDRFNRIISVPTVTKSNEYSCIFRNKGNELYNAKKYLEAFEMYVKSLLFAETDSECMGLAYNNRSAVLYVNNYYSECLKDIDLALGNPIPHKTMEKLLVRKQKAIECNRLQRKLTYYYPVPCVKKVNRKIPCASASIEIKRSEKYGRHVVAVENIKVGHVISVEDSFVNMIHMESKYLHCHHCLELCYNLIPCDKCTNTLYCGEECLKKAQSGDHKFECSSLPILQFPGILFTRMTTRGLDELQNKAEVETDNVFRSDSFKVALDLETNESKRDFLNLAISAVMACIAYHSLRSNPEFRSTYDVDPQILKSYLYKTYMVSAFNPFDIKKVRYQPQSINVKKVGTAIYNFASVLNHSCVPNVELFFHGTLLVTRALANISKGEQCCINYGTSFSVSDYNSRQKFLRMMYYFDCDCRACSNQWAVYSDLRFGKHFPASFSRKLQMNTYDQSDENRRLLREILTDALRLVKVLEGFQPCKNFLKIQSVITDIYSWDCNADLVFETPL
nr:SET and MYND domain-containing protein 4-like [Leptinotarsa decemlineata]